MEGDRQALLNASASISVTGSKKSSEAEPSRDHMIPRTLSPRATDRRTMSPNASPSRSPNVSANDIEPGVSPNKSKLESSLDSQRNPIISSNNQHKDYQRYKYYSALRTGYGHLGLDAPELEPPSHVIEKELFLFQSPFSK